jgi:AmpE protein
MTFLAMIIALLLVQAWGSGSRVQRDDWFEAWAKRLGDSRLPAGAGLAITVLAPVVVAQLILGKLAPLLFGLPWIVLASVLLLYSMGRRDYRALLDRYRGQCRHGDFEGAYLTTLAELGWTGPGDDPGSPPEVHELVQRGFFYEGYQRWFAVLFYFVLLGPAGALAYRLLQLSRGSFGADLVDRCLFFVDWVPVRFLAATFALAGDFVGSRDELLHGVTDIRAAAPDMLQTVGRASLNMDSPGDEVASGFDAVAEQQIDETASLLFRSAACWVVVISLLVLLT